jgi:phytol kinase
MNSIIALLFALAGVCVCVVLGEYLRRVHLFHAEVTRKFIHITVASFAATWPFFMELRQIGLISMLMLAGIVLSRYFHLFRAIHGVQRRTWGELFFAMSIGFASVLAQSKWVFVVAMLTMGLADGLAAIIGLLFGAKHRYKVFGHQKSRAGTITFFVATFIIIFACSYPGHYDRDLFNLLWLPLLATAFENIAVAGTDNLFVPMLILVLLT